MDWRRRYTERHTPWDLWQVTPPLERLLASGRLREIGLPDGARVAVPGCGRGHDLRAWARAGYRVTGFDIVPEVVAEARELLRLNGVDEGVEVLCRDALGLGAEFAAAFDLVYDYTCFCAVPRHLRAVYGREMAAITRPDGLWLCLAFPMDEARAGRDGPPFVIRPEDLEAAVGGDFSAQTDFPAERSVIQRDGAERWFVRRRRRVADS